VYEGPEIVMYTVMPAQWLMSYTILTVILHLRGKRVNSEEEREQAQKTRSLRLFRGEPWCGHAPP
jgi:hypothetical protein